MTSQKQTQIYSQFFNIDLCAHFGPAYKLFLLIKIPLFLFLWITYVWLSFLGCSQAQAAGPLRVCTANPRYFTDNTGKAIYLTGSHTWANLIDQGDVSPPPAFEWNTYLNWMQGTNQNYMRLWIREMYLHTSEISTAWYLSPESMYKRSSTPGANGGGNRFNLDSLDDSWFGRLRQRCIDAGNHGIYVDIVLFDGWSVWNRVKFNVFDYHPYKGINNINGIDGDPTNTGNGQLMNTISTSINAYQFKYVKRLIDGVNDLDNILFEVANEASMPNETATDPWIRMMVDTIHAYELRKPKQHPVGYSGDWTISNSKLTSSLNHSDFIGFAQGNNGTAYEINPPAADGNKVVILDTDHLWGIPDGTTNGGNRTWIWKCLTRGHNVSSMDPWNSISYGNMEGIHFDTSQAWWRSFRLNLGYANTYAKKINLTAMTPQNSLSSTTYCLANPNAPNAEYLVYNPSSGTITVDVSATTDSLSVEWFNPAIGVTTSLPQKVAGGTSRTFTPPFTGDAVLYLSEMLPTAAVLVYPASNQQNMRVDTLILKWHPALLASGYECQISTSPSFSPLVVPNDSTTDTTLTVRSLQNFKKYFWRVRAYNIGGMSSFTVIDSFITIVPIPAAPILVSPRSTQSEGQLTIFTWHSSAYATKYHLQVATDTGFSVVVRDIREPDTTTMLSTSLAANTLHYWHVSAIDTAGESLWSAAAYFTTGTTGVNELGGGIPKEFALLQNYPNPFNPSTAIRYDLPKNAYVKMTIYDILGRVAAKLVDGVQSANRYSVTWNPSHVSSGIYFCRLEALYTDGSGKQSLDVKRMVVLK
jgi:Secretion system C-terminal sorting domain/Putative collagen-binding domain of a collagenase